MPENKCRNKPTERREENPIKNYFLRLFGKITVKNEAQFLYLGKWLIFLLLLTVEVLMLLQSLPPKISSVENSWKVTGKRRSLCMIRG